MPPAGAARRHVVFCADRNYLPYFGVAAYSLLANNARHALAITLVTDGIDEADQRRVDRLAADFDVPITVYRVSDEDRAFLGNVIPHERLGIATWFRLLVPRAVPETVTKLLYLDSDIVVDGDIAALLDGPVAGKVVGVCPDLVLRKAGRKPGYFNAGVLLIDAARWRAQKVSERAIAYASGRGDLPFSDQDALNAVIGEDAIQWLGLEYNYTVYDYLKDEYQQELDRALGSAGAPRILHFAGTHKPWHAWFLANHADKYLGYAGRSPWSEAILTGARISAETADQAFRVASRYQRESEELQGEARMRRSRQAEALHRRILASLPEHANANFNLGIVLRQRGRAADALDYLFRALKLRRKSHLVYSELGLALEALGWNAEAAACHRRAGDLLRMNGDAEASIAAYERALAAGPRDVSARHHLGAALLRLNRHAEAAQKFGQVLAQVGEFAAYARFVAEGKSVATVRIGGVEMKFHVGQTTHNVGVDLCHVNGQVYEQQELAHCRAKLKAGAAIVDVGASTGNHLVYFARLLNPRVIIPVEPHPESIRELRENIALNGISCVDESCLGKGAGAGHGIFKLVEGSDLAQASLDADPGGSVTVAPLDDLIGVAVDFLKIDAEGMEIDVLNGARRLIAQHRPSMLVEVAKRNREAFLLLSAELGYAVEREFVHEGYTNYFLAPPA